MFFLFSMRLIVMTILFLQQGVLLSTLDTLAQKKGQKDLVLRQSALKKIADYFKGLKEDEDIKTQPESLNLLKKQVEDAEKALNDTGYLNEYSNKVNVEAIEVAAAEVNKYNSPALKSALQGTGLLAAVLVGGMFAYQGYGMGKSLFKNFFADAGDDASAIKKLQNKTVEGLKESQSAEVTDDTWGEKIEGFWKKMFGTDGKLPNVTILAKTVKENSESLLEKITKAKKKFFGGVELSDENALVLYKPPLSSLLLTDNDIKPESITGEDIEAIAGKVDVVNELMMKEFKTPKDIGMITTLSSELSDKLDVSGKRKMLDGMRALESEEKNKIKLLAEGPDEIKNKVIADHEIGKLQDDLTQPVWDAKTGKMLEGEDLKKYRALEESINPKAIAKQMAKAAVGAGDADVLPVDPAQAFTTTEGFVDLVGNPVGQIVHKVSRNEGVAVEELTNMKKSIDAVDDGYFEKKKKLLNDEKFLFGKTGKELAQADPQGNSALFKSIINNTEFSGPKDDDEIKKALSKVNKKLDSAGGGYFSIKHPKKARQLADAEASAILKTITDRGELDEVNAVWAALKKMSPDQEPQISYDETDGIMMYIQLKPGCKFGSNIVVPLSRAKKTSLNRFCWSLYMESVPSSALLIQAASKIGDKIGDKKLSDEEWKKVSKLLSLVDNRENLEIADVKIESNTIKDIVFKQKFVRSGILYDNLDESYLKGSSGLVQFKKLKEQLKSGDNELLSKIKFTRLGKESAINFSDLDSSQKDKVLNYITDSYALQLYKGGDTAAVGKNITAIAFNNDGSLSIEGTVETGKKSLIFDLIDKAKKSQDAAFGLSDDMLVEIPSSDVTSSSAMATKILTVKEIKEKNSKLFDTLQENYKAYIAKKIPQDEGYRLFRPSKKIYVSSSPDKGLLITDDYNKSYSDMTGELYNRKIMPLQKYLAPTNESAQFIEDLKDIDKDPSKIKNFLQSVFSFGTSDIAALNENEPSQEEVFASVKKSFLSGFESLSKSLKTLNDDDFKASLSVETGAE